MRLARWITVAAVFGLCLSLSQAAERIGRAQPDASLLREVLTASGIAEPERTDQQRQITTEIQRVLERFDRGQPSYRRARALHRFLHRHYLTVYVGDADQLLQVVEQGRYNCLSATLFYGLIAQALGYDTEVQSIPGHLTLRLTSRRRPIEIETTVPYGFDVATPTEVTRVARHGGPSAPGTASGDAWMVTLREAIGFAWLNTAWRELDRGESVRAAESVREAALRLPALIDRAEGANRLLVRAFRDEYEAGRFDDAFAIALIDVELFPGRTTSRDRVLAAALKLVEQDCDGDNPTAAWSIVETVQRACSSSTELARYERRTYPVIAVAAVRLQDWALARRATERYDAVEPDRFEAQRLQRWVEFRERSAGFAQGPARSASVDEQRIGPKGY